MTIQGQQAVTGIRRCETSDRRRILEVINAAAQAYRGVIPAHCWHDPYMRGEALDSELAEGVVFSGMVHSGQLVGVMGMQCRHNVDLIRHAYVLPEYQGRGIGSQLLRHLSHLAARPLLVGTWAAADWAIGFYARHGFAQVQHDQIAPLLRAYWSVSDQQIAASVVMALPPIPDRHAAYALINGSSGACSG